MTRLVRLAVPLVLLTSLAACLTDPFGTKPEVRGVEIPEKPAEPAKPEPKAPEAMP